MYSMKEACTLTNMTYENLKFYCNEGLVPNVKRDRRNYRVFDEHDIKWIQSLNCLKSCGMRHLIRGYNLTHILQWICFHIRKPSFFRSLASNPNLRKSPEIRRFLVLIYLSLTSRLPSRYVHRCPNSSSYLPQ